MNPVLVNIGPISIRWYSILILLAFTIGYILVIKQVEKRGINKKIVNDICFNLVIISIIGARIYYCLFNLDYYSEYPMDILKIWEGGLAIHGGILAGLIYFIYLSKKKKIDLLNLLDIFAPSLALGQAIGRWGNFFNGEAFGSTTTLNNLKSIHIPQFIIDGMYINHEYHHPTFLYESICCLIIFIVLILIRNKKNATKGEIIALYCIGYGVVRFFIESLRTDSLMLFNFKAAQIVSIIMIVIGIVIIIKSKRGKYDK